MSFRFITWQGSRWLYTHSIWLYFKTSYVPMSRMYLFTRVYSYNIKHCYFVTQLCTFTDFTVYTHPISLYHILYTYVLFPQVLFWHAKNAWFQVQRGESIIGSRRRFHRKLQVDGKLIWVIRKGYESYIYIMRVEFLLADSKWIIEYGDSFLFWYE